LFTHAGEHFCQFVFAQIGQGVEVLQEVINP
jgi:hypothetical protein